MLFSVVIHNLDIISVTVNPFETYTPLVITTNTVVTITVAAQSLQPITGWYKQILQRPCPVKIQSACVVPVSQKTENALRADHQKALRCLCRGSSLSSGIILSETCYYVKRNSRTTFEN